MKISKSLIVTFIIVLISAAEAFGQCAAMYKQGQKYMKAGEYEQAITEFKKAMECDPGLAAKCKQSITQCNKALKKSKKAQEEMRPASLSFNRDALDFRADGGNTSVIVESEPNDWTVTQNPDWIKVASNVEDKTTIGVAVLPNESFSPRQGVISVRNSGDVTKNITVKQDGLPETLDVNYNLLYFNKNKKCVAMSKDGVPVVHTNKNEIRDYGTIDISGTVKDQYEIDERIKPDWVNFRRADTSIIVEVDVPKEKGSLKSAPDIKSNCRVYSFILKSPSGAIQIPITICQLYD